MAYWDVTVKINPAEAIGEAGSWYPLIYVADTEVTTPEYNEFFSLTEVLAKYEDTTDPVYKVANLIFMQDKAPEKIAIYKGGTDVVKGLAPIIEKSWRQLVVINADNKFDKDLAEYIEATEKMYFTHFASKEELVAAKITSYDRTVAIVSTSTEDTHPEAALVGRMAGYVAGSATYHCKEIKAVEAEKVSLEDLNAIHEAGGFCYVEKNGRIATSNGITGSGEWIDVMDSYDYLIQNIRYDVQELFLTNPKIPYTNEGISIIDNTVYNRLKIAFDNGMIATDDNGKGIYSTNFRTRSETTAADRTSRNYPYG
jgi:hypothetical protein